MSGACKVQMLTQFTYLSHAKLLMWIIWVYSCSVGHHYFTGTSKEDHTLDMHIFSNETFLAVTTTSGTVLLRGQILGGMGS